MLGLEHVENLIIGFIPALFDGLGNQFVERRFLQLAFSRRYSNSPSLLGCGWMRPSELHQTPKV